MKYFLKGLLKFFFIPICLVVYWILILIDFIFNLGGKNYALSYYFSKWYFNE